MLGKLIYLSSKINLMLGKKVKDIITGFTGIATSKLEFLTGCTQIGISPPVKKGEPTIPDTVYVDISRVEVLGEGPKLKTKVVKKEPGGPITRKMKTHT
jgi:hypothetical protein